MILPPLSELLKDEEKRHRNEVSRITRFHKFITDFEENGGTIEGVSYKLSAIGDCVARFVPEDRENYPDYFFDAEKHEIPDLSHSGAIESDL